MSPSNKALAQGKADYKSSLRSEQNPYKDIDTELAEHWLEGYQMASYEERQKTGSSIN